MSQKLKTLGLVETTSKTQQKNGTRRFHDPITNCDYLSYSSGYIRRAYTSESNFPWFSSPRIHRTIYQLNKTRKGIFESSSGKKYECTERIMIHNETDRLERLAHCVATYRKNNK